jgi:EthD domain
LEQPIYKILLFLKRNPSMSVEEFRNTYETVHAPFCAPLMKGACRYFRRYTTLMGAPHAQDVTELDFDVITELWYEDRATYEAAVERIANHKMPEKVLPREQQMFDGPKMRVLTVVECESDLRRSANDIDQRSTV